MNVVIVIGSWFMVHDGSCSYSNRFMVRGSWFMNVVIVIGSWFVVHECSYSNRFMVHGS